MPCSPEVSTTSTTDGVDQASSVVEPVENPTLVETLSGPVLDVAPRMLGGVLRHGEVAVRITEVEAYDGANDPGSHAYRGRTARTATMFGPPGHLYVYFVYGMHHCCNIVTGHEGEAAAVLLRAGEVVAGHEVARARRGQRTSDRDLARGPARLTATLAIDLTHDGIDLARGAVTWEPPHQAPTAVASGPRVGLRQAADWAWRFWLEGEPSVSLYRPAAPSRRR